MLSVVPSDFRQIEYVLPHPLFQPRSTSVSSPARGPSTVSSESVSTLELWNDVSIEALNSLEHTAHYLARSQAEEESLLLRSSEHVNSRSVNTVVAASSHIFCSPPAASQRTWQQSTDSLDQFDSLRSVLGPLSGELGLDFDYDMSTQRKRTLTRTDLTPRSPVKKSTRARSAHHKLATEMDTSIQETSAEETASIQGATATVGTRPAAEVRRASGLRASRASAVGLESRDSRRTEKKISNGGEILLQVGEKLEPPMDSLSSASSTATLTPGLTSGTARPLTVTIQPASDNAMPEEANHRNVGPRLTPKKSVATGPASPYRFQTAVAGHETGSHTSQLEVQLKELAARQAALFIQAEQERFLRNSYQHPSYRGGSPLVSPGGIVDAGTFRALTNIYINNLPETTTDEALYQLGSVCGTVVSHKAMIDLEKGTCKGYGFIMFSTPEEAQRAIIWFSSNGFQTSYAKESFSAKLRRMADRSSTNVYLSNLPVKFTPQQLEQIFAPHPVISLRILTDANGESRGVGFVRLCDREVAQESIDRLHGKILPGTTQPLQVRFADSDAQKQLKQSMSTKRTIESLGLHKLKDITNDGLLDFHGLLGTPQMLDLLQTQSPAYSGLTAHELLSPNLAGSPALTGTPDLSASSSISSARSTPNMANLSSGTFDSPVDMYANMPAFPASTPGKRMSVGFPPLSQQQLQQQQLHYFNMKHDKRQHQQTGRPLLDLQPQPPVTSKSGLPASGLGLAAAFGGNADPALLGFVPQLGSTRSNGLALPMASQPNRGPVQIKGLQIKLPTSPALAPIRLGANTTPVEAGKPVRKYAIPIRAPPKDEETAQETPKEAALGEPAQDSEGKTSLGTSENLSDQSSIKPESSEKLGTLGLGLLSLELEAGNKA